MMPNLQENAYFRQIYSRVTESGSIRGYRNPLPRSLSLKINSGDVSTFVHILVWHEQLQIYNRVNKSDKEDNRLPKSITPLYFTQNCFNATFYPPLFYMLESI